MAAVARHLIFMLLWISAVESRILRLNSSDELISDGINGPEEAISSCRHQYGFLPCAENAAGYIFMIVVYQVLLVIGNDLIERGSEVLFYITGPEFGGILFRILRALPSMSLAILTGIYSDKANAESQVSLLVGVYAGITVFSLTVQWVVCMVSARKPLEEEEDSVKQRETLQEKLCILIDDGVKVDEETCKTAGIMLLSLIPYLVLQLVYVFNTSSGKRFMTLIALIVSSLSVILYFAYQIRNPWMQKRSLQYSKLDIVERRLVQHVEKLGKLVKEDGSLDVDLVKRFFDKADKDDDKCIAAEELEKLVKEVFNAGKTEIDQNDAMNKVLIILDKDKDEIITEQEFIEGFKKWIHDAKHSSANTDFDPKQMFHKAYQLLRQNKENNSPHIDKIMSKILKQAEGQLMRSESLITDEGEPNIERIKSLFRDFDTNGDGSLTATELKQLIGRVKFGTYQMKDDDVLKEMFQAFDRDQNGALDEEEFINGVKGYLDKAMKYVQTSEKSRVLDEFDKVVWKEELYGRKSFFISIFQVLLGISMVTFLGGPLMSNILDLSNAMNLPSFIISFVMVPLAMNARAAVTAAVLPASKKRDHTASLAFSEIYGGVIMNNIVGLTTLLAIVYAKDLTWDFAAEVLTILVVCGIVGGQAFLGKTCHLWTCIPASLLYPISLALFYFCGTILNWI